MDGVPSTNGVTHHRVRPLGVDEALQYSPMSSIVPFGSELTPAPTIGPSGSSSLFTTPDERNASRQSLDSLNAEAYDNNGSSGRLQRTLEDLQRLLEADELTEL
ncbi:MAG: Sister chromatid cohesion protein 2 [Pycnora praestabilis]|nr:MAG: Sister chromatid cohesion protein 2 [Pycnora praestabilis]